MKYSEEFRFYRQDIRRMLLPWILLLGAPSICVKYIDIPKIAGIILSLLLVAAIGFCWEYGLIYTKKFKRLAVAAGKESQIWFYIGQIIYCVGGLGLLFSNPSESVAEIRSIEITFIFFVILHFLFVTRWVARFGKNL